MVAVTTHHVGYVPLNPFLKEIESSVETGGTHVPSLYPLALGKFPFVAGFVHHHQTQFVAQVIHIGGLRIVAHADGIGSHLLQVTQTAFPHIARDYAAQHTSIVVQTYTFHLHPFAVQGKSFVGIELEGTQTYAAS